MHRAFVIGMGEVGRRLAVALEQAGWEVLPVTRRHGWEAVLDPSDRAARLVAVREEPLADVLQRLGPGLLPTLVLVQNGFLEPVHGELEAVTRGLIYFTSKSEFYRQLCPSPFYGPHATTVGGALAAGGISTGVLDERADYLQAMIVKGIWNAVVGLPLAVHQIDLSHYLTEHRGEFEELVEESAAAAGAGYGVTVDPQAATTKILETTRELGWVRGGAKALPWRNGAIAWFGRKHGIATPVNDRLLRAVGYDPTSTPFPAG